MAKKINYEHIVPFHDVDSLNVVWHGHYVKYYELARCELLDSIDYGYNAMRESGYAWPVIDLQSRFIQPLRFEQKVIISAEFVDWDYRLKIKYRIKDAETGQTLSKASTVQVAVDITTQEMSLECPPILKNKLKVFS